MLEWDRIMGPGSLSCVPALSTVRRGVVARLQSEHLRLLLPKDQVLSITEDQHTDAVTAGPVTHFLIVLDLHAGRHHRLNMRASAREKEMLCQASLQRLAIVSTSQAAEAVHHARFDGLPEIVDILELFSWSAWTGQVRAWESVAGQDVGTRELRNSRVLQPAEDWRDPSISTWSALRCLHRAGWRCGKAQELGRTEYFL